jgi:hypothetical protein
MTPTLLREAGVALYGPRWQTDMARDLDVADRTIRRWANGQNPMPNGLRAEIHALLTTRRMALTAVRQKLARTSPNKSS